MAIYYTDYENGNDSNTGLGWWGRAIASPTGSNPPEGTRGVGATSGAICYMGYHASWSGTPTIYIYGKNGTFVSETINWDNGATCTIAGDFPVTSFKTAQSKGGGPDEIRFQKSPDPSSIGNGTWVDEQGYITLESAQNITIDNCEVAWSGDANYISTINTTPTAAGSGYTPGDILTVTGGGGTGGKVVVNTVGGSGNVTAFQPMTHANAERGSGYSQGTGRATTGGTGTGATVNITAVANVVTRQAGGRQGSYYMIVNASNSPKVNAKQAFYNLGTSLDLSAYQKLTFFLNNSAAIADAVTWKICLCSDTNGDTIVDTFFVPAIPTTSAVVPLVLTKDGGGNLGNAIQSIAIYVSTTKPSNASTVGLDNFSACTTNGLNLLHLISKNDGAVLDLTKDQWFAVGYINGTEIGIGKIGSNMGIQGRYFCPQGGSTNETVTTYMRETIKLPYSTSTSDRVLYTSNNTYIGGYDKMTNTKNGMTWFDQQIVVSSGKIMTWNSNGSVTDFGYVRGYYVSSTTNQIANGTWKNEFMCETGFRHYGSNLAGCTVYLRCSNCNSRFVEMSADYYQYVYYNNTYYIDARDCGIQYSAVTAGRGSTFPQCYVRGGVGLAIIGQDLILNNPYLDGISTSLVNYGLMLSGSNILVINPTIKNYLTAITAWDRASNIRIRNPIIDNCTNPVGAYQLSNWIDSEAVMVDNYDENPLQNYRVWAYGNALTQTSIKEDDTTVAWRINITSASQTSTKPDRMKVAVIACVANQQVTVTARVKQTHATDIGAKLFVSAGQLTGITEQSDVHDDDVDWETLTVQFTPTVAGVAEVELLSYWRANTADESIILGKVTVAQS